MLDNSGRSAPALNIPASSHTVKVSVIHGGTAFLPTSIFMEPKIKGHESLVAPSYSFLVESTNKNEKVLFDLGIIKNWRTLPAKTVERIEKGGWTVKTEKDVPATLQDNGVDLSSINGIIWSHPHWDHTGDPSLFPSSTKLIVGPGFIKNFLPGFPSNPDSLVLESAFKSRPTIEIDFDLSSLKLGRFRAFDYWGDGSFYLLDSPGHTLSHLCALARTTSDTFVLMGGDVCHHGGEFRPTEYLPLPKEIRPNPREPIPANGQPMTSCPGAIYETVHPEHSSTEPFYRLSKTMATDHAKAVDSAKKVEEFDANDNIFVIIAHDNSLLDVLDVFPLGPINDWHQRDLGNLGRWRFLQDFDVDNE